MTRLTINIDAYNGLPDKTLLTRKDIMKVLGVRHYATLKSYVQKNIIPPPAKMIRRSGYGVSSKIRNNTLWKLGDIRNLAKGEKK